MATVTVRKPTHSHSGSFQHLSHRKKSCRYLNIQLTRGVHTGRPQPPLFQWRYRKVFQLSSATNRSNAQFFQTQTIKTVVVQISVMVDSEWGCAKIEQNLSIRDFKWMTVITKVLRQMSRKQSLGSLNQFLKPELLFLLFSEAVTFTITIFLPCPFSISLQKLLLVSIKERSLTTAPPLSYSRTTLTIVAGQRRDRSPNKRSNVNELLGIGGVSSNRDWRELTL